MVRLRTFLSCMGRTRGGLRGCNPPPPRLLSNFFAKKVIFAIFRATTPPPFRTEWWTKEAMRGCNPFQKFQGPPTYCYFNLDTSFKNNLLYHTLQRLMLSKGAKRTKIYHIILICNIVEIKRLHGVETCIGIN